MPPKLELTALYLITGLLASGAIYFFGWIW
jgi:hypothetical protein